MKITRLIERFTAPPNERISLQNFDPGFLPKGITKQQADELLAGGVARLSKYQDMLYAQDTHAVLVIFQGMDASGKDSAIKHVMSGVNPQAVEVHSFKAPSLEELDHDYMWRCTRRLPERGRIGIFNRSWYEDVLIVRVHPELLRAQHIPEELKDKKIWQRRFNEIASFEKYLENNGVHVVKIFLNISKEEQRRRFLARIERLEKNWKFSLSDVQERAYWEDYMAAYEDCITHTSTKWAPWYIVPADHKWVARLLVAGILNRRLKTLGLAYPTVNEERLRLLQEARQMLDAEAGQSSGGSALRQ
jgi:PPK2 family polyphosphate:nucleotide phosphotransferase